MTVALKYMKTIIMTENISRNKYILVLRNPPDDGLIQLRFLNSLQRDGPTNHSRSCSNT